MGKRKRQKERIVKRIVTKKGRLEEVPETANVVEEEETEIVAATGAIVTRKMTRRMIAKRTGRIARMTTANAIVQRVVTVIARETTKNPAEIEYSRLGVLTNRGVLTN